MKNMKEENKKEVTSEEEIKVLQLQAERNRLACVKEIEDVLKKYGMKLTVVQNIQVSNL